MSARVRLHPLMQELAGRQDAVEAEGDSVGECLSNLVGRFPMLSETLFDRQGRLLKHVEIYVNGKTTFPQELAAPVKDGDELSILLLLAGG